MHTHTHIHKHTHTQLRTEREAEEREADKELMEAMIRREKALKDQERQLEEEAKYVGKRGRASGAPIAPSLTHRLSPHKHHDRIWNHD